MGYWDRLNVNELVGKTLSEVTNRDNEELIFRTTDGETYRLLHYQDCCEFVRIEDIVGNLNDLVGVPILMAEEVSGDDPDFHQDYPPESYTWTFYKFGTVKGYVDVRWLGESNGHYSESVDFYKDD